MAAGTARHAGGSVGRMAVLRQSVAVVPHLAAEHVQPDRHRYWHSLDLQRRGTSLASMVAGGVQDEWGGSAVLRSGCSHHDSGVDGAGAGTAGAIAHEFRRSSIARSCAEYGNPC